MSGFRRVAQDKSDGFFLSHSKENCVLSFVYNITVQIRQRIDVLSCEVFRDYYNTKKQWRLPCVTNSLESIGIPLFMLKSS